MSQKHYSLGVDLWSTGCIFAEMAQKKPLFMGDSEIDQIFKIFKILGTPHENNWPDALKLQDFKASFPKFRGIPMQNHTPTLNELEVDLLKGMTALDPNKRISAKMALFGRELDLGLGMVWIHIINVAAHFRFISGSATLMQDVTVIRKE